MIEYLRDEDQRDTRREIDEGKEKSLLVATIGDER